MLGPALLLVLVAVLALDGALALPGADGLPGIPLRLYVAHLLVLAALHAPPDTSVRLLRRLALGGGAGLLVLGARDAGLLGLPERIHLLPSGSELGIGSFSALLWLSSLWVLGYAAAQRRHDDKKTARALDDLSGVFNQQYFDRTLPQLLSISRRRRQDRGIGLLMIDLDNFKQINDRISHLAGDDFISALGTFLASGRDRSGKKLFRDSDYPCRIGGDEFAVIITGLPDEAALKSIEARFLEAFDAFMLDRPELLRLGVGCSVGSVFASPGMADMELRDLADQRMYEVKKRHHEARDSYRGRSLSQRGGDV